MKTLLRKSEGDSCVDDETFSELRTTATTTRTRMAGFVRLGNKSGLFFLSPLFLANN